MSESRRFESPVDWPTNFTSPAPPPQTSIYALWLHLSNSGGLSLCAGHSSLLVPRSPVNCRILSRKHKVGAHPSGTDSLFFSLQQVCQSQELVLSFYPLFVFLSVNQGLVLFATILHHSLILQPHRRYQIQKIQKINNSRRSTQPQQQLIISLLLAQHDFQQIAIPGPLVTIFARRNQPELTESRT